MSSIFQYVLIAISVAFASAQISIGVQRCKERVITKCQCGPGGNLTDVYVDGCRVISNDSFPCQPCPGSCNLFLNCEKCSKHDCLSCPLGKTGPTCDLIHSDKNSIAEKNHTAIQNAEESASSTNATLAKNVEYGFDQPMAKMVVLDLSKIKNSSFRSAIDDIRPEIKLDMIEFNAGNTSIVEVIPLNTPYISENNSTDINETVLIVKKLCTTNCSNKSEKEDSVGTAESNQDVLLNNETDFGNENAATYPQKNDTITTSFKDKKISGEFLTFGEQSLLELPSVHDSVNTSDVLQKEYSKDDESRLAMHRSPNPSAEENKTKILRHVLKKTLNNEHHQLELGNIHQHDFNEADQQDYPENPAIASDQRADGEIQNKVGSTQNNDSRPEFNRKTTPETKYVYVNEKESKYPDAGYESSYPLEQEQMSDEEMYDSEEIEAMKPDEQYYPRQLKQYFDSREEANLKPTMDPFAKKLRMIVCNFFSNIRVSCQSTVDDTHPKLDLDSHVEPTFGYFRSPEGSPNTGSKLFFPNTENEAPSTNFVNKPAMDTVKQDNDEHSEIQKNGFVDLKREQPIDAIQQQNDQYLENHGNAPKHMLIIFASLKNRNTEPMNSFAPQHQKTPGQTLVANITHDNGTAPRIVPGSVDTKNLEVEIEKLISLDYADSKKSNNPKTERPEQGKGPRRFRKLLNKRRRNGVKNDSRKCDPRIEDCSTIHDKSTQTYIRRKTKHAMNSKAARKDRNNLGYVRIRYVKDDNEPMYDSIEISESSMPNENAFYSQTFEYDLQPQNKYLGMENFTSDSSAQASSESNSDSESNGRRSRSRREVEPIAFCPIPRDSRNGNLDCTIWSYKKTCTLVCHNGYTSPSQYFTCQRSKNTWVPPMTSCKGGPQYEPLEETRIQLKQLDENSLNNEDDDEEEPLSQPRDEESNKDYDEKSSGETGVRDQNGDNPVKTHAHKKKGNLNKEDYDEKSSGEMGVPDQDGDEGAAAMTSARPVKVHSHKKKGHVNSVNKLDESLEGLEVPKAQAKGDKPVKEPVAEDEAELKEEAEEVVPKKGSGEEQSGEDSAKEEVDEAPKDQEIQEVGQNDVQEAEYDGYERRK